MYNSVSVLCNELINYAPQKSFHLRSLTFPLWQDYAFLESSVDQLASNRPGSNWIEGRVGGKPWALRKRGVEKTFTIVIAKVVRAVRR